MAFIVFADGSANLPKDCLEGITLLPCSYCVDGVQKEYQGDIDSFDVHHYYDSLRGGARITASKCSSQFGTKTVPTLRGR